MARQKKTDSKPNPIPEDLRIVDLRIENYGLIRAASRQIEGDHLVFTGRNRSGKSTALEGIIWALSGDSAKPLGGDKAVVELNIAPYRVRRQYTPGQAPKLFVVDDRGGNLPDTQAAFLKSLSPFGFDLLKLLSDQPKAFRERVTAALKIGELMSDLDAQEDELTERRKAANREVDVARARVPDEEPESPVSEPKVSSEELRRQSADKRKLWLEAQKALSAAEAAKVSAFDAKKEAEAKVARLEKELRQAKADASNAASNLTRTSTALLSAKNAAKKINLDEIERQIEQVEKAERAFEAYATYQLHAKAVEEAEAKAKELDDRVKEVRSEKEKVLADALKPLAEIGAGVDFESGCFTLHGRPASAASGAEALRLAIEVAALYDPTLRTILIEGDHLDDASLVDVLKACDQKGLQAIIARWASPSEQIEAVTIVEMQDGEMLDA